MWIRQHQELVKDVKKETIWALWNDVNHWPTWHGDLDYCQLKGDFAVGNFFMLKPKKAPAVKIIITDLVESKSFTDCTQFFGAKMTDTHVLEETPEGLLLTNTLTVTGPLKWLWIHLVARHVADSVPDEMKSLVNIARQQHA